MEYNIQFIKDGVWGHTKADWAGRKEFRGGKIMAREIPVWEKYTLSIEEAAEYFRIGQKRLRQLVSDNPDAEYILMNGNRVQIKRKLFEQYIDVATVV